MTLVWHWPQITLVSIWIGETVSRCIAVSNGRELERLSIQSGLFSMGLTLVLLYYGGFFAGAQP